MRQIQRFGLLGERISHSFSPLIHTELGDYEYRLYPKDPDEVEDFLKHGNFNGLNVTIPYKKTVIPYCSGLSATAQSTGSVNTIIRREDGSLYGDNTDFFGFEYLIKKTGVNPADGKTLVLGSGGASLTVQAVLKDLNAKEIVVISRTGPDHYGNIERHSDAIMIVNTTPVGMYPNNGLSPIDNLDIFKNCTAVIDLIYNPARTELLLQAEERGILAENGLVMLVAQAKVAAERFTQSSVPDIKIEKIISKLTRATRNIVLIGMPGCGKTSIGMALAEIMNREFADTDKWIVNAAGKSIPRIFAEDGEETFRKMERETLKELCKRSSLVIATGGGVVKNPENLRIIRQNGIIIFLDRDIAELSVSGRPLSQRDGIKALAEARLPLYAQWGEFKIPVRGIEKTAVDTFKLLS